ncbi:flagellar FlbD family protein [Bilifractor sp. LCP21S3_A7]|uniref:flagellar FlbD family protein n=1 Tax=Bilifractor sp. LCP21S3_A7 TaxID=3438738 RepID=UPI003F92651D
MIKLTRLNGEVLYLNFFQIVYLENIPETKVKLANGDFYIVKDSVESILAQVREFIGSCFSFSDRAKETQQIR